MARSGLLPFLALAGLGLVAVAASSSSSPPTPPKPGDPPVPPSDVDLDALLAVKALECNGLCYGDPLKRTAYLRHLYPGDLTATGEPNAAALDMGRKQSSCLLSVRGVLAACDVDGVCTINGKTFDVLRAPYAPPDHIGQVETWLRELARQRGALVSDAWKTKPQTRFGDVFVIGWGGSAPADPAEKAKWLSEWGGVAHGAVVTYDFGPEGIQSGDGGQTDVLNENRPTAIAQRVRKLHQDAAGRWWLGDRRLNYIIRAGNLPRRKRV